MSGLVSGDAASGVVCYAAPMLRPFPFVVLLAALGPAACAGSGDPPSSSGSAPPPPATPAASPGDGPGNGAPAAGTQAGIDTRDVAILTLEQGPSWLRVTGHNRRPRASFGPSATWNGAGRSTHRWRLVSRDGQTLAAGDVVVHSVLEAPPNPQKGAPAAHAVPETFAFVVKAPHPAPGEALEIAAAAGSPVVRWP